MQEKKTILPCPHCGKMQVWSTENSYRPFCSKRCKLIDLGAWADESHRLPGDPINPEPGEEDSSENK